MEINNLNKSESSCGIIDSGGLNENDYTMMFRYERDKCTVNNHVITVDDNRINLNDLKLKTIQSWKVMIRKDDISKSQKALESPNLSINLSPLLESSKLKQIKSQTNSKIKRLANLKNNKYRKLKEQEQNQQSKTQSSESIISTNEYGVYNPNTFNFKLDENVLHLLNKLDGDELKLFNFTLVDDLYYLNKTYHIRIDEAFLIEKYKNINENKSLNISDFKKDQIVWSQCRNKGQNVWWPSRIVRIIPQRKNCKFHVYIKHYEMTQRWGNLLKIDTTQIEPFFWSVSNHYNYKSLGTEFKPQRFEFFTAYSNALIDFTEQYSQADSASVNCETVLQQKSFDNRKYLIHGRLINLDEIKRLAYREPSRKLNKVLNERIVYSQNLINLLVSNEAKDFIVSIITKRTKNKRHINYLIADTYTREKHLKCESTGPLNEQHQQELKRFLNDLSEEYFLNKPENLIDYEKNVLYPEALIWAIKKLDNLSDMKAERKYKLGFTLLDEEILKEKCLKFLLDLEINENNKLISSILEDFKLEDYNYEVDPIELIEPSQHGVVPEPITDFNDELDEDDSLFGSDTDSWFGDDLDTDDIDQIQPLLEPFIQHELQQQQQQQQQERGIKLNDNQSNQQMIIIPLEKTTNEIVYTEQNVNSVDSGYDETSPSNFDTIGAIIDSLMISPKANEKIITEIETNNTATITTHNDSLNDLNELNSIEITDSLENDCYFFEYDIFVKQ